MKQEAKVTSKDRLYIPEEVVFRPFAEGWLVVFVQYANWILINDDFQKELVLSLIKGNTIGDVFATLDTPSKQAGFRKLLAALFARDLARTDHLPSSNVLDSSNMLNCYLTNACNLRCRHCFMNSGRRLASELSITEWERVFTEFKAFGGESVTFTGGEPLMNPDFSRLVNFVSNLGLTVTVLSNGTLWTTELINQLAPFIGEIQISLDGFDELSNSKIRGKGLFSKVVDTIVQFANNGVRTSVATTFTFDNLTEDTAMFYKLMVERIRSRCKNPVFFKLSKKILKGRELNYTEEENLAFRDRIAEIESFVAPEAEYNNFMEGHAPGMVTPNCGFGGVSIAADGEVYFCNRISEVESFGNIRNDSIGKFIEKGNEIRSLTDVDSVSPCRSCHLRYICSGGCRIDDFNFKGKIQSYSGNYVQINCSDEYKAKLERKMIEAYKSFYKF